MKPEYLYAVLGMDGRCRAIDPQGLLALDLAALLAEGWQPVRETTFGNGFVLVLLERGGAERVGFGFGAG
jgi:hypothetical protein